MKEEIIQNLDQPKNLEKLYQANKGAFKNTFLLMYPEIQESKTAQVWYERLNYQQEEISWGSKQELIFILIISFLSGIIAKIPNFTSIDEEFFYSRNLTFVVFPALIAYFSWKQKLPFKRIIYTVILLLITITYINLLPTNRNSDSIVLACIHLPLFYWIVLGFTFTGKQHHNYQKRFDFLRYNGDLIIMTALILLAGLLLTGITLGLFSLINLSIEQFYFEYIVIWGLAAAPIVGTYLVQANPQLVNKVAPIIAKVFTPLILITLVIYLVAIVTSGKDPYNDREFLMIFNLLLIGVLALIVFSIAENWKNSSSRFNTIVLIALSCVTILVNAIALSAILFRISEWGFSPNRLAVLGGNSLILINLILVTYHLIKSLKNEHLKVNIENSIASFLPIYGVWTIIVTFLFPLIFGFK
jgi:hypothetical protein